MYCSRCGKALRDEDIFCSYCGARVFRTDIGKEATTEEIVFNPSFEGNEHTEENPSSSHSFHGDTKEGDARGKFNINFEETMTSGVGGNTANKQEFGPETEKDSLEFVWDLYEFPTDAPRKTEDINFDWSGSVAAEDVKQPVPPKDVPYEETAPKAAKANKLRATRPTPKPMAHTSSLEPITDAILDSVGCTEFYLGNSDRVKTENTEKMVHEELPPQEIISEEEEKNVAGNKLEKELFGDVVLTEAERQTDKIDKFYTFNKKNEEFQLLLDKEYEKIKLGRGIDPQFGGNTFDVGEKNIKMELEQAYGVANPDESEPLTEGNRLETVGFEPWSYETAEPEGKKLETEEFDPIEHLRQATEEREKSLRLQEGGDMVDNDSLLRKFDTMELTRDLEALNNSRLETEEKEQKKNVVLEKDEPIAEETEAITESVEDAAALDIKPSREVPAEKPFSKTQALDELFGAKLQSGEKTSEPDTDSDLIPDKKKKHVAGKVILTVIIVLLIVELIILGIKIFAPSSSAAAFINDKLSVTYEWLLGDNNQNDNDTVAEPEPQLELDVVTEIPETDKNKLVSDQLSNNENIANVSYEAILAYNPTIDYGVDDINHSAPISNNIWYTDEDGKAVGYDRSIVATLIAFDSQWINFVNNKDEKVFELIKTNSKAYQNAKNFTKAGQITETFDALQIGEIRQGQAGFYVWTHEDIRIAENSNTTAKSYNWIYYLEPDGQQMKIVSYYAF